ncbi:hypothetical protein C0Q70_04439 [Pomacea canaliculata]|uniref:Uncharacterized protein n=1 Tax=Pomacea canaliculata TaxID=400727 RepID=A0A2T7PID9_POMCA|nr:hypothetical protein C0Q70_04439 [Pomacea canaliculata]
MFLARGTDNILSADPDPICVIPILITGPLGVTAEAAAGQVTVTRGGRPQQPYTGLGHLTWTAADTATHTHPPHPPTVY